MTDTQDLINAINRLSDALRVGAKKRQWQFMYIGSKAEKSCWYEVKDSQPIPMDFDVLIGHIEMIDFEEREYKGKLNLKLKLLVVADHPYHIQVGADTIFAKNLYAALKDMSAEQLTRSIELEPYPGDEDTVFLNIIDADGNKVRPDYNNLPDWKTGDWTDLRLAAQAKVEQAMKLRGKPTRLRQKDDNGQRQPASRPAPSPQGGGNKESFDRLKYVKGRLKLENSTVLEAIKEANPEAANLGIPKALYAIAQAECTTAICNLLWWHGTTTMGKSEEVINPLYQEMFVGLEGENEREAISKFIAQIASQNEPQKTLAEFDDPDIPF